MTLVQNRPAIAVCVCTYKRNEPLRRLLNSVLVAAELIRDRAVVGIVIADDNPDGGARPVANEFDSQFDLGVRYVHIGKGNISLVRNAAIELAIEFADFVASTDDDCVVPPAWLDGYLQALSKGDVTAATSRLINQYPVGSPSWLADEPFSSMAAFTGKDGDIIDLGATNNSMLSANWLRQNPDIRFKEDLGKVGGEDMVFFGEAKRAGLRIRFVEASAVVGEEPSSRATLSYQLRSSLWLGNTMAVTTLRLGQASRVRLLVRGVKKVLSGVAHPLLRVARRSGGPQFRWSLALALQGVGLMFGSAGIRINHH